MALKIKGGQVKSLKQLKASMKKGGGGPLYMKRVPSDGGITVRFLTEPTEWFEYLEYFSEEDGFFPAVEGMDPGFVADLNSPSKRWLSAAVDTADNSVINLVLPKTLASNLIKKYEKYGTLLDRDYELIREGSGFETEYDALPEAPSKMNLSRFDVPDLWEVLEAAVPEALGGGGDTDDDELLEDEDEEETPRRRPRKTAGRKSTTSTRSRRSAREDEDDEDETPPRRKPVPKKRTPGLAKKKAGAARRTTGRRSLSSRHDDDE